MVTGLSSLNIEDTWRVYPVTMVISVISCGTKTNQPNTAGLSLQLLLLLNEILWIRRWKWTIYSETSQCLSVVIIGAASHS